MTNGGGFLGLGRVARLADPRGLAALSRAGALDLRTALSVGLTLPWILGRGPSLGIASQLNALGLGNKAALIDRAGTVTFRELDGRANRAARGLRALGVRGGDRVALLLRNGREMAEMLLAAQKAGVVAAPLNTWASPRELAAALEGVEAPVLVYDVLHAEQVRQARKARPEGALLVAVGPPSGAVRNSLPYEEILEGRSSLPLLPVAAGTGSNRIVVQTSGTTGRPKGAARDAASTGLRDFTAVLSAVPLRRDDVLLCPAPMFHSFGLLMFAVATVLGATVVLPERFEPKEALELIERHGCTSAALVPVMIARLLELPKATRSRHDTSSLRMIVASGSALPQDLRERVRTSFGDLLYDLYGSTEVGWVGIATPEDALARPGTVGRAVAGVDVSVRSREGDSLPPGETGEIFVRSGMVFHGYTTGDGMLSGDGYVPTGDVGRIDDDGYIFVEGRADDMVVVGGENVRPEEVEDVIRGVRGVRDVAVAGVADDDYGQVLAAFVVGSARPETILRRCRAELASFKVPRRIHKLDELPRNATGKVLRRALTATSKDLPRA